MARDKIILRWGDEFNKELRAGEPRNINGRRLVHAWYTYEFFKSYATDKIMADLVKAKVVTKRRSNKSVIFERPRYVWYSSEDGMFYRLQSNRNKNREGDAYLLVPFHGTIWSCYPKYQSRYELPDAEIVCVEGKPTSVRIGDDAFEVTDDSWPTMESFLGLDESYKQGRRSSGNISKDAA